VSLDAALPDSLRLAADDDLREYARDSLIGIHPDQNELRDWATLMETAADEIDRLEAEVARVRQGVQDMPDGNYPHPRSYRPTQCPHGAEYWHECPSCNDAALQGILAPPASPASSDRGGL
jgi:lipopolysaccharide biosynthesis regulator YciM